MKSYYVTLSQYVPNRTYNNTPIWSGFVQSEKETCEEVKQEIMEHHKKKGVKGLKVSVYTGLPSVSPSETVSGEETQ